MKNWFLKFGCQLIGYNWQILSICSEVSAVRVKRYTSALLIISILWFGIGFTFCMRYLQLSMFRSIVGAVVLCFIIIMVERQIILSSHNSAMYVFRLFLGLIMSVIGSIVIDQIILGEDINLKKKTVLDEKVNKIYPVRSEELSKQIEELKLEINNAQIERNNLNDYLINEPIIYSNNYKKEFFMDGADNQKEKIITEKIAKENPRASDLPKIDERIKAMTDLRDQKNSDLLKLHSSIVQDISQYNGFLDELDIMLRILKESTVALVIWLFFFAFLMSLEILILVTKIAEKFDDEDDYSLRLKMQMKNNKFKISTLLLDSKSVVLD